ncbi:hypothetical protein DAA48_21615 [Aeromonas veronii]|uniref:Uncharacterized protein n=2 Tax=Aeromonas veronii TaxID=654 RepID=A0A2T4MWS2_AERVE|nr:hypothetical protein DAA48_21615 [Aeromonas veronii]
MEKTLKELIQAIHIGCKEQGRSDEFFHRAIIFLMEWELDFSMVGNGWIDNDPETLNAISEDDVQVNEFNQFFKEIGIIGWYNKE